MFSSPLVGIAECRHPLHDGTWEAMRFISVDVPLVVFPRLPVAIRQLGSEPILAGPNVVMLYNPDVPYRREPRDPGGDDYLEFQLGPAVCAELEEHAPIVRDGRFRATHAPAGRAIYLQQYLLANYLRAGDPDPLLAEEAALWILHSVLAQGAASRVKMRAHTKATHREIAEAAKEVIGQTVRERLTLGQLALRVGGLSPTHLARIFRSETGFGLHEYRLQLRLRTALHRLRESAGSLTALAHELGFSSHSHFTVSFRRQFGVPPSLLFDDPEVAWRIVSAVLPPRRRSTGETGARGQTSLA